MNAVRATILVLEDDPNDVLLIQRAFRRATVAPSIQVEGDGEQGVAYLAGQGPYADRVRHPLPMLLLLDLKLPRLSGFEVLEWLRRQPGLKRLPVIILTSSRQSADIDRAYDLGANSYLVKPVASDALRDMVRTLGLYWITLNENPTLEGG